VGGSANTDYTLTSKSIPEREPEFFSLPNRMQRDMPQRTEMAAEGRAGMPWRSLASRYDVTVRTA